MLVKTVQVNTFRLAIDSIKDILGEVTLVFDPVQGLTIPAVDTGNNAFVHLNLKAERFEVYDIHEQESATFDISQLYKIVKNVTSHSFDALSLSLEDDKLKVVMENTDVGASVSYELRLVKDSRCELEIPDIQYGVTFFVDAKVFARYLRDIQAVANMVQMRVKNKQLVLVAMGALGKCKIRVPVTSKPACVKNKRLQMKGVCFVENNLCAGQSVTGKFVVRYLTAFCKAACLGGLMCIKMAHGMPICCEFVVGNLGILRYYLCPQN